jgi:tape measure domain-containing protein
MSTEIDQKVVEMRFDNRQFEENIKTSMSSLERLKQSLKLENATKGFEDINRAASNLKLENATKGFEDINRAASNLNLNGIVAGVEALQNRFSTLGIVGMRVIENLTDSMMRLSGKIFGLFSNGIIQGGINRAMNLENAHFQLQGLLKDEQAVADVMQNVSDSVDGTAYGLDAAAKVASQFAASGMTAGDEMFHSLRAVAGVAAMTNSSYDDIGRIFTQVAGQGRLMGDQLLQLSGRGMNAAAVLAEHLGKSESQIRDMVSKGKIDFKTFAEAMDDAFGEHAKKANETFTGAMSNVKAALGRIGAEFVSPLIVQNGPLVQFFNALRERINDVKANIGPLAELFTGAVTKMANSATDFLKNLDLTDHFKAFNNIVDVIHNLGISIISFAKPIRESFSEVFSVNATDRLLYFTSGLKIFTEKLSLSGETADKLKRTFKGVFSIFDILGKIVVALVRPFGSLFDGASGVMDIILTITALIGDFFISLNEGLVLNNFSDGFSKLFSGISDIVKDATKNMKSFSDSFLACGKVISNILGFLGSGIKAIFSWIADNVSIGDIFAGLAGGGIYVASKKFIGLMDKIKDAIGNIFGRKEKIDSLKETFSDVLGSVKDTLISFTSGIKVVSLLSIAGSIAILSAALKTISKLNVPDLTKSMTAIGIMLSMLSLSFKSITKTLNRFPATGIMKSGASLILMAGAIKILADAMVKISSLSPEGVAKGLTAIGVGLAELTFGMKMINKVEIKISTSIALLALAKSCQMLGDALAKFGGMSWGGIVKGLAGMGGALAEFVIVLDRLSKLSGAKSIVGSIGLLIAVQSLGKLADGFKKFGEMSWNGIGRGLIGMGGALTEVAGISGALGKIAGFSGILGSIAIVLVVDSLGKLADGFKKFGEMSWGGIAKGLVGMGGALAEVAGISGALGKIAGISGILGSSAILIAVQGLGKLAEAFKEFGSMSWGEIGRGLVGMGGALAEVAGISGGLGILAGLSGIIGGAAIWTSVQGLEDLASAFKKFGEMSWDEIKRGLASMGGALGELAVGGFLNTFSILGSLSISTMSEDLGVLADSLKKWTNILVPENLGEQLGLLAKGIMQFTFGGAGASALATSAEAVGTLAASAKKWAGVVVPDDIKDKMSLLSAGIMTFTFSEVGGAALVTSAEAVGILADSVRKWENVSVPENIEDGLKSIANGVSTFASTFVGGWSMSSVTEPLKELANAVTKWNKISVPESLGEELSNLAGGINNFAWSFMSGWSLDTIVEPLGALASSVLKWKGVSVPEGISEKLESLADGVKAFIGAAKGGKALGIVAIPLGTLADSVKKWSDVSIPSDLAENMGSLADGVKKFKGIKDITKTVSSIDKLANAAKKMSGTDFNAVNAGLNKFVSSLNNNISNKSGKFTVSGVKIGQALSSGITKGVSKIKPEVLKTLTSIVAVIKEYRAHFYAAGAYVVDGFAKGISANTYKARAVAKNMAEAADEAARKALDEESPSKVFYKIGDFAGMGFVNGLASYADKARDVSNEMGVSAKKGLKFAISRINDFISSDIETSPTIRPVLDLSDVTSNARSLSGLLESNPAIGLTGSINTMMNRRVQNGINEDVVSAINKLAGKLGNIGGDSYTINGVTYDDGSNVSDAVKTLVRAAKVERRV